MRLACLCLLLISSISFAAPVQRVISLSPHTTELAYAAGLGKQLIAASDYSDYPEAAKSLERVANYRGIKLERIVALKPDLILAWKGGNPPREMEKLAQLGFTIYYSNPLELEDIPQSIEALGQYSANPQQAKQVADEFRQTLNTLKTEYKNQRPVRYFYQLSNTPIITVADKSWPSQVFTLCGGLNIFADSPAAYPQVSEEQVVVRQPEVIFGTPPTPARKLTSGKNGKASYLQSIISTSLPYRLIGLIGQRPRTIKAVEQVCDRLNQVRKDSL